MMSRRYDIQFTVVCWCMDQGLPHTKDVDRLVLDVLLIPGQM
jgi:hypothetical protein